MHYGCRYHFLPVPEKWYFPLQTGEFVAHLLTNAGMSGNISNGWHYFFISIRKILHEALSVYSGNTTVDSMGIRYFLLFLGCTQAFVTDAGCCGRYAGTHDLSKVCYCRKADRGLIHLFNWHCPVVIRRFASLVPQDRRSFCNFLSITSWCLYQESRFAGVILLL